MSLSIWLTEQPAYSSVGIVPPQFEGGHVLRMLYDEANQFVFTVDRYYDGAGNLLPSKLHRFNSTFSWEVGIPHAEIESGSATNQFVDMAIAGGAIVVLRRDESGETSRYYIDKLDPHTLNLISALEVYECKMTAIPGSDSVWLIGKSGVFKRLNIASMLFEAEQLFPTNVDCGRAVYDPVMGVIVIPKKVSQAAIHDAITGEFVGNAPFPWQGPGQFAHVVIPPHGTVGEYSPPVVSLVELDAGLQKSKLVLFQRDEANKNYISILVEIPFCTDVIAPHGQIDGYVGLGVLMTTADNRPPGTDAECAADPSRAAKRAVFVAKNGYAPSSGNSPSEYFVGRRVDIESYQTAPMFAAGLPELNPFMRHLVTTHETAKLWLGPCSLDSAEQRAYPSRTLAV